MYQKKGFTLIELLVVIAIVALLLGILVPMLNKAKMYAEEILCKSNLRQYGIATELYCNDNDAKVPDPWESLYAKYQFVDESQRYCRWHNPKYNLQAEGSDTDGTPYAGPYWPYLAATKANICPTFARLAPKYGNSHYSGCIGGLFEPQFSYSMNTIFSIGNGQYARKDQVKSPSQTFIWAEENMWTLDTPDLSNYVLNDNALLVNTGPTDCFGSYHKISTAQLTIQRDTNTYKTDTGVANVLMVDGSTRWLTPLQSLDYVGSLN